MPNYIKYIFKNVLFLFIYLTIFRLLFYLFFLDTTNFDTSELKNAFFLGMRFDLKLATLIVFPIAILVLILNHRFFLKSIYKKIAAFYWVFSYIITTVFYLFDFGFYSYLNTRIDATALRFTTNLTISLQVLIESYPVFWGIFGLFVLGLIIYKFSNWQYKITIQNNAITSIKKKSIYFVSTFVVMAFFVYNSFTHYPLRWSQAFFSKNIAINQFALNPVLYFFDSFAFRSEGVDLEDFKKYYSIISKNLNLPKDQISFERKIVFKNSSAKKMNVVFVMLESLGVKPLGYYGNAANSSPHIDSLLRKSIHFSNFYVHKSGTAASVFSSVTGLPDVDDINTASRNPMIIDQRILFDQFDGYEKLYLIGGSANWANIRGIFQANISGLHIFEEGSYDLENRADVWGIDDYELFKESDEEFKKLHDQKKPFVAYIQTASNHIPFTVPNEKDEFKPLSKDSISAEVLEKSGFKSIEQLNALRYLDFNVGKFLQRAKTSGYYDNTVFVFFGDHNTAMNQTDKYAKEYDLNIQLQHVPFIIHAPKLVVPIEIKTFGKLIDLFPTVMSLMNINHTNYTLGRNLLDPIAAKDSFSFVYLRMNGEPTIGILKDSLYFSKTLVTKTKGLFDLRTKTLDDLSKIDSIKASQMDSLLMAYYHSTKYLYFNNKKLTH
jgi:phosphoglycerol transferase MdoB-like AlkP superfamily enzyme